MSLNPPPPPGYLPPGVQPPYVPYTPPPRQPRPLGGDIALKLLIGSAACTTLGFGTCSISAMTMRQYGKVGQTLISLGIGLFFLGLAGLAISTLWLLIAIVVGGLRR